VRQTLLVSRREIRYENKQEAIFTEKGLSHQDGIGLWNKGKVEARLSSALTGGTNYFFPYGRGPSLCSRAVSSESKTNSATSPIKNRGYAEFPETKHSKGEYNVTLALF